MPKHSSGKAPAAVLTCVQTAHGEQASPAVPILGRALPTRALSHCWARQDGPEWRPRALASPPCLGPGSRPGQEAPLLTDFSPSLFLSAKSLQR